ncbi:MAG: S9 family peptidase [Actinobacteria bacterium]|nr:S9 family peptidase [Actinomycetota bacterium]
MQPPDLSRLHSVTDPRVHPDGQRVAFVVSTPDIDGDTYRRTIHLWDPTGGDRQLTHGPKDRAPRWSPAGDRLAFLRTGAGDDDHAQLAVLPADGGEAHVRTELPLGVTDLAWSPDGTRLVVVGVEWIPELAELDDDERSRRPRRITRLPYRGDLDGWIHDRRSHLWLVDLDGEDEPRCLTPGDFDEWAPAFRRDGRSVVFVSQRGDDRETHPGVELYELALDDEVPTQLLGSGMWSRPVCLDDDELLVAGLRDPFEWPAPPRLFRLDSGGGLADLSAGLDRDVAMEPAAVVTADGYLTLVSDRGRVHVYRFRDDGPPELLVGGDREITGVSASPDGPTIAFTATTPTDPGELWRLVDGDDQTCTALNEDLRANGGLITTRHTTFTRDGVELDAWVLLPDPADDDIPLLLSIHGGPTAQYGFAFFDEFQVYATAGYAVVGIDPRGSSGRGREWARAVVGVWTDHDSVDTLDLEAAVDMMLERHPRVSPDRLGVMGGSYGGFSTARMIARSERFRSAVVERGLLNWVSFAGTSDIGPFFDRMFLQRTLPDDAAALWAASPLATAHRITTPTLVIHADEDWRCPIEQGEQLFTMLRRNGVDAQLLRFPGENHELSRSGSPKHRVERFEAILDWHGRHLRDAD